MEKLVDLGLVKSIGVSNFTSKKIADLLEFARIKPVCNQGKYNLTNAPLFSLKNMFVYNFLQYLA